MGEYEKRSIESYRDLRQSGGH